MWVPAALLMTFVSGAGTGAAPVDAKASTTKTSTAARTEWWAPFGFYASVETVMGIGAFVADEHADAPYWASTLSLSPSWDFGHHLKSGLSLSMSYEWTYLLSSCGAADGPRPVGAPLLDCSDTDDPAGRRFDLSDLELWLEHDSLLELEGAKLSGTFAAALPTSRFSQAATNILTLSLGTQLSRSFGVVTPSIGLSGAKFFPTDDAPTLSAEEVLSEGVPIAHCATDSLVSCLALSGFVPDWRASLKVGLGVDVPAVKGLSFAMSFGYSYSRRFSREPDAFSSTKTDVDGNLIVDGRGESDSFSGTISGSYALDDHVDFSLGVATVQPVFTEDGQSVRFPFYDFISPANNYTGWFLSVGYTL